MVTSQPAVPLVPQELSRLLTIAVIVLCATGCGDGNGDDSNMDVAADQRAWFHEEELLRDPRVRVRPDQVVVLHLDAARTNLRHIIRYSFEDETQYTFCIPDGEPHIRAAELLEEGETVPLVRVVAGGACETHTISPGEYRLIVEHDGNGIRGGGSKAFIYVPRLKEEPPPLGTAVAVEVADTGGGAQVSPAGLTVCNALAVLSLPGPRFVVRGQGSPYPTVFGQSTGVDLALGGWQICTDANGHNQLYLTGPTPQALTNNMFGSQAMWQESDGRLTTHDNSVLPYASSFQLVDLGNFQFQFYTYIFQSTFATIPINPGPDGTLTVSSGQAPETYTIPIKYYLPGVTPPPLQIGEISFNHGCNFDITHGTWVVRANLPTTDSSVTGPGTVLGIYYNNPQKGTREYLNDSTTGTSVRTGPQTVASIYAQTNYGGLIQTIAEDTNCGNVLFDKFNSIKVTPARDFIIATNSCHFCNLTGIDLSNLDLSGGNFRGSNFSGANLFRTNLNQAILQDANLFGSDINLAETSLQDADLIGTNFRGADLSEANAHSSQGLVAVLDERTDVSTGTISVDTFLISDWRYLNLTNATVLDVQGAMLSTATSPVDFSGALLDNVDLHGAILDGANFGCDPDYDPTICASLKNTNLNNASLKRASFVDAILQGAQLEGANLDGANLCSAHLDESDDLKRSANLQRAYLRNVNLYQAVLTGANFANADFYSTATSGVCDGSECVATTTCSTAADATLDSAIFSHAYLAGTDFTDAHGNGVDFERAWLMGANFTSANLGNEESSGNATNFRQADLRGTNFSNATVTNADFNGAFLATQKGMAMVKLDPDNTAFVGFTPSSPSAAGCVPFSYPDASATPSTDGTNTCPNSGTGPCSQSAWTLPTPTPGCSSIDFNWGVAPDAGSTAP